MDVPYEQYRHVLVCEIGIQQRIRRVSKIPKVI